MLFSCSFTSSTHCPRGENGRAGNSHVSHLSLTPLPGITEAVSKCKCVSPFFLNSLCSKCGTESQEWGSTPYSDRSSLFGLSL